METKNSKMFEKFIKDSFENHEAAYDPKEWSIFEKKFDKVLKRNLFNKFKYASIGSIIIVALVAVYIIKTNNVYKSDNSSKLNTEKELIQTKQPIVNENQNLVSENTNTLKPENQSNHLTINKNTNKSIHTPDKKVESITPVNEKVIKNENADTHVKKSESPNHETISKIIDKTNIQNLTIDVSKMIICADEDISFFPSINNQSFEYNWNFGDGNFSSKANPVHTYDESGSYEVKLTVKDIQNTMTYNASLPITVNSKPDAMFDFEIVQDGLAYPQVKFLDKSSEALYWEWNFGDEKISYEQNPIHVYFINSDKKVKVSLSAMNIQGCKSKAEKTIAFNNVFDLMAPNAFSPDGDGLNDYFIPKALEVYDIPFEMFIYDRAGTLIYNTKSKSNPWDGRNPQTGLPEKGTFIWIVILKDSNGNDIKYGGTVSIIK